MHQTKKMKLILFIMPHTLKTPLLFNYQASVLFSVQTEKNLVKIFFITLSYILHLPSTNHGGVHTYRSGERLNGIQEVSGSIPLISTITKRL